MDSSQYGILEIAGWQDESFDDGPMIRTVLFLQGAAAAVRAATTPARAFTAGEHCVQLEILFLKR